jgi:hypothetical protein
MLYIKFSSQLTYEVNCIQEQECLEGAFDCLKEPEIRVETCLRQQTSTGVLVLVCNEESNKELKQKISSSFLMRTLITVPRDGTASYVFAWQT